ARAVASRLKLTLETIPARAEEMATLCSHYDEPFADSSAVPLLALARALRERYKVILTGDGGDEAFGGCRHYEWIGPKQVLKSAAARLGLCDGKGPLHVYLQSKALFRADERRVLLNGDRLIGHWQGNALAEVAHAILPSRRPNAFARALATDRQ